MRIELSHLCANDMRCREKIFSKTWPSDPTKMIKSELVHLVHQKNPHLHRMHVEKIVDAFFERIIQALADGVRVEVRGFGVFSVKERQARVARNPRTGEQVSIPGKKMPYFRTGKEMRHRVNEGVTSTGDEGPDHTS